MRKHILWLAGSVFIGALTVSPALAQEQRLLENSPANATNASRINSKDPLTQLLREGRRLANSGNVPGALAVYRQAADLDKANPKIFAGMGFLYASQGNYDAALGAYQQAIALDPKNADFHYALGFNLASLGSNDEALSAYRQAIVVNPRHVNANLSMG
ncbi:MAG: tetratricopeptide repeat protein, partial [Leptolyngbyaceae cyanobacterium CAN_BIN12]|nr:tetratricopeptide repeat protein [Leptolyngbyaceae cyanobacterium CAN_BIN12]